MQIDLLLAKLGSQYPGRAIYLYDIDGVSERVQKLQSVFGSRYKIHFAMKANHFPLVLQAIRERSVGVDVVSGGELSWALQQGFPASEIVFSGIGKTVAELTLAITEGVKQINVESEPEFDRIVGLAKSLGQRPRIALRVNPNVEADTHPYIRTGLKENKFGIDFETCERLFDRAIGEPNIIIVGCSLHIGSQIRDSGPFREAIERTLALYQKWQKNIPSMKILDVGGGLGMDYQSPDLEGDHQLINEYAKTLRVQLDPWLESGRLDEVLLEPGRCIVARFGKLYAQVEYVKRTSEKNFLVVNTGMHHLMRPMLYQAFHRIECVKYMADPQHIANPSEIFDIVGPICESSDTLGRERLIPSDVKEGDWVVIHDTGAYGSVMKNNYNLQLEPVEIGLKKGMIL